MTPLARGTQIFLLVVTISLSILRPAAGDEFQTVGGDHFIVCFVRDEAFAKEVLRRAEGYYFQIAADLGYPRYSAFWTWDNRVKIFIYSDRATYQRETGQQGWSEGVADYTNKQIASYINSQGFIDGILPHEIAHLIFRDFVGFKGEVPLWLDEGVAQWSEPMKRERVKEVSKYLLEKSDFFSVEDMVALDIRKVGEGDVVTIRSIPNAQGARAVLSVPGGVAVVTYYIEAASLVGFLVDRYGASTFTVFCRQLRDGKSLNEALRFTYPVQIRSIAELEQFWLEYLRKN